MIVPPSYLVFLVQPQRPAANGAGTAPELTVRTRRRRGSGEGAAPQNDPDTLDVKLEGLGGAGGFTSVDTGVKLVRLAVTLIYRGVLLLF